MGIRRRILLSFLALFLVVFLATALVSTVLIGRVVDQRLATQTQDLARTLNGVRPEVVESYLGIIMGLYGAEGMRVGPKAEGRVPGGPSGEGVYRALTRHGDLVVVYAPEVVSRERGAAVKPFAVVAAGGLLLVLVLGYLTARAVAGPLEGLAAQARSLPAVEVRPVGGGAELDHLVEAMNRMLAEVRRGERLAVMGQMAAGIAHEIRNPLSSMKMTVQMLREGAKEAEPYDLLLREIERLELTAAELVGTSQPLRKERVKLDAVVSDVLELMKRRLEHLSVKVERRYSPVPDVEVDVARFKRCVMNLLLNGAQAMPAGGPLAVAVAALNGKVRFSVTDAGSGVPEEVRGRVFEPFVTTKQDGVGLGLALTKRIVEDHGGAIGFDPAERGTTFWIDLPHG